MEKRNEIKRKDWDSDFFNLNVGYVEQPSFNSDDISLIQDNNQFDVIYLFSESSILDNVLSKDQFYYDQKVTLEKRLISKKIENKEHPIHLTEEHKEEILPLCVEAGKYSRFKLDPYFSEQQFLSLYEMWCDNSLNNQFADLSIGLKNADGQISGILTLAFKETTCHIGLIAVAPNQQGLGIGSRLLNLAEFISLEKGCDCIHVPTQLINAQALSFYEKNGFKRIKVEHIYHLWKR